MPSMVTPVGLSDVTSDAMAAQYHIFLMNLLRSRNALARDSLDRLTSAPGGGGGSCAGGGATIGGALDARARCRANTLSSSATKPSAPGATPASLRLRSSWSVREAARAM